MSAPTDRPGPSLRRFLTLYLTVRPPVALVIDGLFALAAYNIVYHLWASLPQSLFYPRPPDESSFAHNLFSPALWMGRIAHLILCTAWIIIGVGGVRYFCDALSHSRAPRSDSDGAAL